MSCFSGGRRLKERIVECHVELLDQQQVCVKFKGCSKGQELMDYVCSHLNLYEKDYFGLRYIDETKSNRWLDLQKNLVKQLKELLLDNSIVKFYFSVKFYATDPCKLKEEITRYQFFLQLKKDISAGRIPLTYDTLVELGALVVQSECGDFDKEVHTDGYVSEFKLAPNQSSELELAVSAAHERLVGYHPAACEYMYLDKIKWHDMYGVDLHLAKGAEDIQYYIGPTPSGIVVYKQKIRISIYYWPRIVSIFFKGKTFAVKVKDKNGSKTAYYFTFNNKKYCKDVWKACIEHHTFFRLNQAQTLETSTINDFFHLGSKFRYSGRTERELSIQEAPRSPPQVKRTHNTTKPERRRPASETMVSLYKQYVHSPAGNGPLEVDAVHKNNGVAAPGSIKSDCLYHSIMSTPRDSDLDSSWVSHGGMFTTGRDSPKSVRSDKIKFPAKVMRSDSGSEADSFYHRHRAKATDSSDDQGSHVHYLHQNSHGHKRESDNDSERSAARRRRRRGYDSNSDADSTHQRRHHHHHHHHHYNHHHHNQSHRVDSFRDGSSCSGVSTPRSEALSSRKLYTDSQRLKNAGKEPSLQQAKTHKPSNTAPNGLSTSLSVRVLKSQQSRLSPDQMYPQDSQQQSTKLRYNKSSDSISRRLYSGSYENIMIEVDGNSNSEGVKAATDPTLPNSFEGNSKNATKANDRNRGVYQDEAKGMSARMRTISGADNFHKTKTELLGALHHSKAHNNNTISHQESNQSALVNGTADYHYSPKIINTDKTAYKANMSSMHSQNGLKATTNAEKPSMDYLSSANKSTGLNYRRNKMVQVEKSVPSKRWSLPAMSPMLRVSTTLLYTMSSFNPLLANLMKIDIRR